MSTLSISKFRAGLFAAVLAVAPLSPALHGQDVGMFAKMNVPFGTSLTQIATLPPGAQRDLVDPYAEKKKPWGLYLFLLILAGIIVLGVSWYLGGLDSKLPQKTSANVPFGWCREVGSLRKRIWD